MPQDTLTLNQITAVHLPAGRIEIQVGSLHRVNIAYPSPWAATMTQTAQSCLQFTRLDDGAVLTAQAGAVVAVEGGLAVGPTRSELVTAQVATVAPAAPPASLALKCSVVAVEGQPATVRLVASVPDDRVEISESTLNRLRAWVDEFGQSGSLAASLALGIGSATIEPWLVSIPVLARCSGPAAGQLEGILSGSLTIKTPTTV